MPISGRGLTAWLRSCAGSSREASPSNAGGVAGAGSAGCYRRTWSFTCALPGAIRVPESRRLRDDRLGSPRTTLLTSYYVESILNVVIEVVGTDQFEEWFMNLGMRDTQIVLRLVQLLQDQGLALGFPYSSSIAGASFALRELRSRGRPLRIFYAFDPERQAVLLLGGDKTGKKRFYEEMILQCERLWKDYLAGK